MENFQRKNFFRKTNNKKMLVIIAILITYIIIFLKLENGVFLLINDLPVLLNKIEIIYLILLTSIK